MASTTPKRRRDAVALARGLTLAAGLLLASPEAAAAPESKERFRTVQTWGWRAELPTSWKPWLNEKRDPARPYEGKWAFRSPKRNFRLRVKIRVSKGLSWAARTKRTFEKLEKRLPKFHLLAANTKTLNDRELFYVLARFTGKRRTRDHDHLVFRMLVRYPNRKLRVVITLIAADERVDEVTRLVERFAESFALVDPKSADEAARALREPIGEL